MADSLTFKFPDEFAPPSEKIKPKYGLDYARASYFASSHYNGRVFFGDSEFDALVELAQGRQSTENIRKMFNFGSTQGKQDEQGALAWIDVQVLPLAVKYINKAVAKLQRNKYDVQLSAVDLLSIEDSKNYASKIKCIYALKDFYTNLQIDPQAMFPDIDMALLPDHPDELIFRYNANPKLKRIIDGEKSLKLLQQMNDMDQVMREYDWDLVVMGRGHLHCWLDENNYPRIAAINGKYWGGAYVENEDYSKAPYQFFIEFITRDQFKAESENHLTKEEINKVLTGYAFQNTQLNATAPYTERFDGLDYIPVMRYYFLSNDNRAVETWTNNHGGPMIEERNYEYQMSKYKENQGRQLFKMKYTSVYGGSWVVDSDIVYNHRRLDLPRTNLVNTKLPIITFAPNQKQGRTVSLAAQMVEPIYMINVAWNKIKHILADGFLGVLEIDFTALEEISLGQGGEKWTPRQVYEHFLKTKRLIKRGNTNPYGQTNGKAIEETQSGIQMTDYFNTIKQAVLFLDDLTGSSAIESSQLPDRVSAEVMEANAASGNESIEYLINGHIQSFKQASHMLLLLLQTAKKNKTTIKGMIPALGKYTTEYFEVPEDIAYCEYGLYMERQPSPEEWLDLYKELRESVAAEKLNSSDSAFIREIDNLKMARQVMANREAINERKAAKLLQEEREFQKEIAAMQNQGKYEGEMALLDKKKQDAMELMEIQARIDFQLQQQKLNTEGMNAQQIKLIDERIKRQGGIDTIIKEAMRSRSNEAVENIKVRGDMVTSAISSAQKAISDRDKAKQKPKPTAK